MTSEAVLEARRRVFRFARWITFWGLVVVGMGIYLGIIWRVMPPVLTGGVIVGGLVLAWMGWRGAAVFRRRVQERDQAQRQG